MFWILRIVFSEQRLLTIVLFIVSTLTLAPVAIPDVAYFTIASVCAFTACVSN